MLALQLFSFLTAAISSGGSVDGGGLVRKLFVGLVIMACVFAIYYVGVLILRGLEAPPLAMKVWNGIFLFVGLVVVLNFLLGFIDKQFLPW